MFKLLMLLMAFMAISALINMSGSGERIEIAHRAAQRLDTQDEILTNLLAINDKDVSAFVAEWREEYPAPTSEQLSELKDIQQRIKNDKKEAIKMTHAYKVEHNPYCRGEGEIQSVFGFDSTSDCPPGL